MGVVISWIVFLLEHANSDLVQVHIATLISFRVPPKLSQSSKEGTRTVVLSSKFTSYNVLIEAFHNLC